MTFTDIKYDHPSGCFYFNQWCIKESWSTDGDHFFALYDDSTSLKKKMLIDKFYSFDAAYDYALELV